MFGFDKSSIQALEATAFASATYLDACDSGLLAGRVDAAYYRACGDLLTKVFTLVDAEIAFPYLLACSAAAREVDEAVRIGHRIEVSRLGFYPELSLLLHRVAG